MIDEKLLLAHNLFTNKGVFALFLGSGVSRAAGIPTGWEELTQLNKRLASLEKETNVLEPEKDVIKDIYWNTLISSEVNSKGFSLVQPNVNIKIPPPHTYLQFCGEGYLEIYEIIH